MRYQSRAPTSFLTKKQPFAELGTDRKGPGLLCASPTLPNTLRRLKFMQLKSDTRPSENFRRRFSVNLGILAHCRYWSRLRRLNSAICQPSHLKLEDIPTVPIRPSPAATQKPSAFLTGGGNMRIKMRAAFTCLLPGTDCINRWPALSITPPPILFNCAMRMLWFLLYPQWKRRKIFQPFRKRRRLRIFIKNPGYLLRDSGRSVSCDFAGWQPFGAFPQPERRAMQVRTTKNGANSLRRIRPESQMGTKKLRRAYPKGCETAVSYYLERLTALNAY